MWYTYNSFVLHFLAWTQEGYTTCVNHRVINDVRIYKLITLMRVYLPTLILRAEYGLLETPNKDDDTLILDTLNFTGNLIPLYKFSSPPRANLWVSNVCL